ncbi:MAG: hypothetical protein COC12_08455 [Rhodobacteraceae bacterium]|nr:MAG: hypothetical protein COC12_08455 [Paracoccaceae bacterium]
MTDPATLAPKPTAQVEPYVEVLGVDGAIEFLLTFGGAEISFSTAPTAQSRVARLVGRKKAIALARISGRLPRRVPTARKWLVAALHFKGLPKAEIARKLHVTDVAVRKWLLQMGTGPNPRPDNSDDPAQLSLF